MNDRARRDKERRTASPRVTQERSERRCGLLLTCSNEEGQRKAAEPPTARQRQAPHREPASPILSQVAGIASDFLTATTCGTTFGPTRLAGVKVMKPKLSRRTISALQRVITGNPVDEEGTISPHRSGPDLVSFFNELGFDDRYSWGGGFRPGGPMSRTDWKS